jgi:hypothetical protein
MFGGQTVSAIHLSLPTGQAVGRKSKQKKMDFPASMIGSL